MDLSTGTLRGRAKWLLQTLARALRLGGVVEDGAARTHRRGLRAWYLEGSSSAMAAEAPSGRGRAAALAGSRSQPRPVPGLAPGGPG